MAFFYLTPDWFFGFDIFLELIFGIIAAFIAYYSFKVYKLCDQKECWLLGLAFSAISLSYFIWPLLNLFSIAGIASRGPLDLAKLPFFVVLSLYAHILFFILGLVTLVYVTFNVKNQRVYTLLASLSVIVVIFSSQPALAFNFVSALLLFYIAIFYGRRFFKNRNERHFLIFFAFVILFLARASLAFSLAHQFPYVINHAGELVAYVLIMVSLIKGLKK